MNNPCPQGFTALELMVTMTIIAILLSAGVPAFQNYGWNLRMRTAMDVLQTDLNLARGRAISHNTRTIICPANDSNDCSGRSDWQDGWIVFADINADGHRQNIEPLLKQASATEFLNISSSRSRSFLRFFPNGTAPGTNVSILFCDKRGAGHAGKIAISNSGRIRIETGDIEPTANCP